MATLGRRFILEVIGAVMPMEGNRPQRKGSSLCSFRGLVQLAGDLDPVADQLGHRWPGSVVPAAVAGNPELLPTVVFRPP